MYAYDFLGECVKYCVTNRSVLADTELTQTFATRETITVLQKIDNILYRIEGYLILCSWCFFLKEEMQKICQ